MSSNSVCDYTSHNKLGRESDLFIYRPNWTPLSLTAITINNKYVVCTWFFCFLFEKHNLRKSSIIFRNEHNFKNNPGKKRAMLVA